MENTKQQSAVEWLEEQLFDSLGIELTEHQSKMANEIFFKQAKGMFENQIMDAYWEGGQDVPLTSLRCEEYYNKTFKNK